MNWGRSRSRVDHGALPLAGRLPRWLLALAVIAAMLHMLPSAVAQLRTPDSWTFTANLAVSPDYLQDRTWSRQTQVEGPIVSDWFTGEPTRSFVPVPFC